MYLDSNAVPAGAFEMKGRALSCEPYGKGHINETYLVKTDAGRDYILQKINSRIFRDVPALMKNIQAVTAHLRKRESDPRRVLTIVPARGGGSFVEQDGQYFRVYDFVTGSLSLEAPETAEDFAKSYNVVCVLKDARTVIADVSGRICINLNGNNGMATAGSGDVLTGIIASLKGQGMDSFMAASLGCAVHGRAGDEASKDIGRSALMARDIIDRIK